MNNPKKLASGFLLFLVLIILPLSGCGEATTNPTSVTSTTQTTTTTTNNSSTLITIKNFAFNPGSAVIKVGSTVTWTNSDSTTHTITSSGLFDSGTLEQGKSFSYTFDKVGTYNYNCSIHPSMKGQIIVEN